MGLHDVSHLGARTLLSVAETGLTPTLAARVIGVVPEIGAWAGFCSNDTVSGRDGGADLHPSHFTMFLLSFQHETTAARSDDR